MRWKELRPRMFVRLTCLDHALHLDRVSDAKKLTSDGTEIVVGICIEPQVIPFTIRGQIKKVTNNAMVIEGGWFDEWETEFGVYTIVRGAIKRIHSLSPPKSS